MIEILQTSAERSARIVRQVLGFSRSNEGERGPVDPRHILREMLLVVQETFPRNIEINDDIPNDLDQISANPTQIHQLLLNLSINARDAMPEGGILTISGENCRRTSPPPKFTGSYSCRDWLKIVLKDNGTGIPAEALEQIWMPFYPTKMSGEGTGLGLSTVRGLVTSHGGFTTVYSTVGRGTSFEIWLPTIDPISVNVESEPATPARPGRGERILVVNDEPSLRDMISNILNSKGYDVIVAAAGVDALASVNVIGADLSLVITDVHMPHMSGDVLVSVLKRIHPDVPVLASAAIPTPTKTGMAKAKPNPMLRSPNPSPARSLSMR
jgi:two-component system cell cycle sensor histidine kinase/response regulator CckA